MMTARRVVGVVIGACAVAAWSVATPAAHADPSGESATTTTTTQPPLNSAAPGVAIELERDFRKSNALARQLAVVDARLNATNAALSTLNSQILDNQVVLDTLKTAIRSRAAAIYARGNSANGAVLDVGAASDLKSAQQYASAAISVDTRQVAARTEAQLALEAQRSDRTRDHDDLAASRSQIVSSMSDLTQESDRDQKQLDAWGAVPVMGDAWLTPSELAAWFQSTGATAKLAPGTTIDDLARLYIVEGRAEHVRGDVAFAQAVVETGSFQVTAGNNYSGIGVCDSCQGGYVFPTPLDGVRAQIQLLRNYADPDSQAALLANAPSPTLYGTKPEKASATFDSFFLKGKAPLWNEMGNGNWATSPTYATSVIGMFARIVQFANSHPS